ncbi:hypothetical protein L596_009987 [Steinernema carpocapsae]|uniref:V-ATPase proteolipid subunit C-like domain-containing protein n=1 Tax=Steinernema carpocapsae TaxID=34508 RepID=A0A4U5PGY3_STECR|nr:hypothetical protein L596_009987 [Steinernema carpocapsae]
MAFIRSLRSFGFRSTNFGCERWPFDRHLTGTTQAQIARNLAAGYMIFGAGLTVGFCNFFGGIAVGIVGSGAALLTPRSQISSSRSSSSKSASAIGLFGFIVGILQSNRAEMGNV